MKTVKCSGQKWKKVKLLCMDVYRDVPPALIPHSLLCPCCTAESSTLACPVWSSSTPLHAGPSQMQKFVALCSPLVIVINNFIIVFPLMAFIYRHYLDSEIPSICYWWLAPC